MIECFEIRIQNIIFTDDYTGINALHIDLFMSISLHITKGKSRNRKICNHVWSLFSVYVKVTDAINIFGKNEFNWFYI